MKKHKDVVLGINEDRYQLNFRVPRHLQQAIKDEVNRIGRKRDYVAERVWAHFLSLRPIEREKICMAPTPNQKAV